MASNDVSRTTSNAQDAISNRGLRLSVQRFEPEALLITATPKVLALDGTPEPRYNGMTFDGRRLSVHEFSPSAASTQRGSGVLSRVASGTQK